MNITIATTMTCKHSLTSQPCNHNCEGLENHIGSRAWAKKEQGIKAELIEKQHKGPWWAEVGSELCSLGKSRESASAQAEIYPRNSCLQSCLLSGFPGLMLDMSRHFSCLMIAGITQCMAVSSLLAQLRDPGAGGDRAPGDSAFQGPGRPAHIVPLSEH